MNRKVLVTAASRHPGSEEIAQASRLAWAIEASPARRARSTP